MHETRRGAADHLKRAASLPAAHLIESALRRTRLRAGVVLVYHRISDDSRHQHGLVPTVTRTRFASHLGHLRRRYEVVPADRLLHAIERRPPGGRFPVAITFDDDLCSHVEIAAPMLSASGLSATFFLCGASLDRPHEFWWERLERVLQVCDIATVESLTGIPADSGRAMAAAIEALPHERRREVDETLAIVELPALPALGASEVARLVERGHAVGFHTRAHDRLTQLEDVDLAMAINDGRRELEEAVGAPVATIAYPHGWADERVAKAAQEAGFEFGFTTAGSGVGLAANPLLVSRFEPSHLERGLFALRLARSLLRTRKD